MREVKSVNITLAAKEKLNNLIKNNKKVRLNAKEVGTAELIAALISKQAELENQKRINS